jgi:hypothetical protein
VIEAHRVANKMNPMLEISDKKVETGLSPHFTRDSLE